MSSDNPVVFFRIVDVSLYTRRFAFRDDYHKKPIDTFAYTPVKYNCLETLAMTFIIPARQKQFIQKNIFSNAPIRRFANAMKTNSALCGSYIENALWYQQFNLKQIIKLRAGQPIEDFDAANNFR